MNLLISYGTRPEYIKILPLLDQLDKQDIKYYVIYTGQHPDLVKTDIADIKLTMPTDKDKTNRLDSVVKHILSSDFIYDGITHVMVQGDTTSAFAVALGAFHREIPVLHLEAGLRTFKRDPYPEEFNRSAITKLASIHFAPTTLNETNLIKEGISSEVIHVVGNTVLDNLVHIKPEYGNTIIVTMHRRENIKILAQYFEELNKIANLHKSADFLFPMHPNPAIQELRPLLTADNIKVVSPIPYHDFIKEVAKAKFIISDSGGLQEEASFFKKRIIICRELTERPEVLENFGFLCKHPKDLSLFFNKLKENYKVNAPSPFGSGHASEKIASIIKDM